MDGVPKILVVDDDPESQRGVFRGLGEKASFQVVHPDEIDLALLDKVDLVLVDYIIDFWPARNAQEQLALRPANGIALTAVLREQATLTERPTGFAIHTGQPEKLWVIPAEPRRHLIARAYNLEWVFLKSESPEVIRQAAILATAVQALPVNWPSDDHANANRLLQDLLGLSESRNKHSEPEWVASALADVENCRPPLTELSERNHGLVFLRWLLQRILPYPCFLIETHRLAARLRVTHASLKNALANGLHKFFAPSLYQGLLEGFLGDRWWRAGVENMLWNLAGGGSAPPAVLREKLSKLINVELIPSQNNTSIVCVDQDYRTLEEIFSTDAVIRIQPDDWPSYASQAWTPLELAREYPRLAAVVVTEEQEKIAQEHDTVTDPGGKNE